MERFNRGSRSGGDRSFNKRSFNNRDSGRPVVMHHATCGKCGKDCEVPFRPTGERPVYCSICFENNRDSGRPSNFGEREMFNAVCDECGNSCQVPFQPSSGKPIYCSNCFGEKKEGRSRDRGSNPGVANTAQFEQLNSKLDKILFYLSKGEPKEIVAPVQEMIQEDEVFPEPITEAAGAEVDSEKEVKVSKKKTSRKKKS